MANIFSRMKNAIFGSRTEVKKLRRQLQATQERLAKVDAASTTDKLNQNHWANADSLGPNAETDPATRARCRSRGRYEAINNGYARGLVRTHAVDLIGTEPRLQLNIEGHEKESKTIERLFCKWGRAVKLGMKYRLMEKAVARDGDAFGIFDTNLRLKEPVKLDIRLVEDEQCETPWELASDPEVFNGVRVDSFGDPVEYYFLKYHPGELNHLNAIGEYKAIRSDLVVHWFEKDRIGQVRGLPRLTSSLPLFAQLRRYTLATLTAAEFAALIAGILKTTLPPTGDGNPVELDDWTMVELVRGTLMSVPEGWEATQMKANQPATTYPEFKKEVLNEAGRGSGAPLNVVSGNSSGYNFSSGRLDHVPYHRDKKVERFDFRLMVNDPVFLMWHAEASLISGYLPADLPPIEEWLWTWNYDGFDGIDHVKDADADDIRLKNGTSTYSEVLAEYGQDWQETFEQLAREKAYAEKLGLPWPILAESAVAEKEKAKEDESAEYSARHRLNGHKLNGKGGAQWMTP